MTRSKFLWAAAAVILLLLLAVGLNADPEETRFDERACLLWNGTKYLSMELHDTLPDGAIPVGRADRSPQGEIYASGGIEVTGAEVWQDSRHPEDLYVCRPPDRFCRYTDLEA